MILINQNQVKRLTENRQKDRRIRWLPWFAFLIAALCLLQPTTLPAQTAESPRSPSTALSGYMDFHLNKESQRDGELDLHRFVLLVTHRFSDRLRFVSELELEHAFVEGLEDGGEIELEQAYLDFLITRRFNLRAGMLLMPVGIINERHEPPVYHGVERPLADTVLLPTTWFEAGAGVHGEFGRGWRYRAYVTAPLNATEFSAEEGIRNGRQKGSRSNVGRVASTGRLEFVGVRGLTAGASFWAGKSGFETRPLFDVPVSVWDVDARYSRGRFEGRGQLSQVNIENAGRLNDLRMKTTGINPNVARTLRGGYLESAYRIVSGADFGDVAAFVRYENVDTQFRMPDGFTALEMFDREAWVFGVTYWPDADVALKADYVWQRNESRAVAAPHSFNIGLGWWF